MYVQADVNLLQQNLSHNGPHYRIDPLGSLWAIYGHQVPTLTHLNFSQVAHCIGNIEDFLQGVQGLYLPQL